MVMKAIPRCWDNQTYNVQGVDPKTGRVTSVGPFSAADLGCPKPGQPFSVLSDKDGYPLASDGQRLVPGKKPALIDPNSISEPTVIKEPNGAIHVQFSDDRPYEWEPTENQRWWLSGLAFGIMVISFVISVRARRFGHLRKKSQHYT
jgi:hypothetical protein